MMDSYLRHLEEAIASATRDMTADEVTGHAEGKWSVGEVLEHLYLTFTGTIKGFSRCLETGTPSAPSPTLRQRLSKLVVVNCGYMVPGRKAPKFTVPRGTAIETVVRDIIPAIGRMDEVIARSEIQFGRRTYVLNHPVLGRLTGREWRKFHWVHGMHHVKQIERLRAYK
jgi:hypothetical protein